MTERTHNIAVGLTAIVALGGLAVIVLMFGYVPDFLERGYVVTLEMGSASGLTADSRVRLSGIDVGRVSRVALRPLPEAGVLVTLVIDEHVQIPAAARVSVEAPMLGGSPSVSFNVADLSADQMAKPLETDGSARVQGRASSFASDMAAQMQKAIDAPARRLDALAGQLTELSQEWVKVGQAINKLVEERDPSAVDAGQKPANVMSVLARADSRLRELEATVAALNKLVNDPQLHEDMRTTAANAAQASAKIDAAATAAQRLIADAGRDLDTLTKRYVAVGDDLSAAIGSMRQTLDVARAGDGTVARLLKDPALYNNLNDAAQRVGLLLDEMKLLLEKWKKEGMKVNF